MDSPRRNPDEHGSRALEQSYLDAMHEKDAALRESQARQIIELHRFQQGASTGESDTARLSRLRDASDAARDALLSAYVAEGMSDAQAEAAVAALSRRKAA